METKTNFTVKVVRELLNHGFSILLYNTEQLEDACGGYCWIDDDKRELSVAMKHHMGFEILIHEYCHFLQWKNDPKFWYSHIEKYDLLFDWINDKNMEVTEKDLKDSLESIIAIEHDCESRVLKLVKNNPIEDFDINKYIRAANSYLWSYHLNRELRQRPNNPIYTNRVIEKMSPLFCSLSYYLDKENLSENDRQALLVEYK